MQHIPLRSCLICRRKFPKYKLLAITKVSSGEILVGQHVSGRSVYFCSRPCVEGKLSAIARIFKMPMDNNKIQQEVENYFSSIIPTEQD